VRVLLAWFSRTGTTAGVATAAHEHLVGRGHAVTEAPIVARWDLPYPLWLALSFVPGSRVRLRGEHLDPRGFDACLLALPKWTFSCPPVNGYLARVGPALPPTALLVTCGGWDQERYLGALERQLREMGVRVLGGWTVKRKAVEAHTFTADLEAFLQEVLREPPHP
jgi:hypothetical protein